MQDEPLRGSCPHKRLVIVTPLDILISYPLQQVEQSYQGCAWQVQNFTIRRTSRCAILI